MRLKVRPQDGCVDAALARARRAWKVLAMSLSAGSPVAAEHRPLHELERKFRVQSAQVRAEARLEMIVLRTAPGQRSCPLFAELDLERGLVGDRWWGSQRTRNAQVTLMDARAAHAIAERPDWPLFGDNMIVDLALDLESARAGRVLQVGSAQLELTDEPHLGCKKFAARFGVAALSWVNDKGRRELRLRGIHARVLSAGRVHVGEALRWVG
jgi:hypothetical protein